MGKVFPMLRDNIKKDINTPLAVRTPPRPLPLAARAAALPRGRAVPWRVQLQKHPDGMRHRVAPARVGACG